MTANKRDQRIADETGIAQALMCTAHGCPNRWSVDAGNGKLCSAHAWVEPHLWPQISQEQQDAETERAWEASKAGPKPEVRHWSKAEKVAVLRELRTLFTGQTKHPRAWAFALRDREQRGEKLSIAQREMWRAAIGAHAVLDSAVEGADIPAARITDALQHTGDIPWPSA